MKRSFWLLLFIIVTINFFLPRALPGDPFAADIAETSVTTSQYTEQQIEHYKAYYQMDQPIIVQYGTYLLKLLQLDLGFSIHQQKDVADVLIARLPWTMAIVMIAVVLSALFGIIFGVLSAYWRGSKLDSFIYTVMIGLGEIPAFLIGLMLLLLFSVKFQWFPLSGGRTTFQIYESYWAFILEWLYYATLPILTLIIMRISDFYMITRSSVATVLSKDYLRTAKGKGLNTYRILIFYLLKNASPPIISRFLMSFGVMIGGSVIVETVFRYPGIGQLMIDAVLARDYVLIQGIFLFVAIVILIVSFLADWVFQKIDPRIRAQGE